MERDEFRDFLLQISIPKESGRTLRFSLVRLVSKSMSSKLSDEKYISLRTVPFRDNYRFVISGFTHAEYSRFKNDYYDQVDFLRINPEEFRKITNIAFKSGLELDEYMSSGRGKLEIKAPTSENRSEFLLKDMENRYHEGFRPYLIKLSGNGTRMRVRADFNFFVPRITEQEAYLIYDITDSILKSHGEMYDRLARFRSITVASGPRSFSGMVPESFSLGSEIPVESIFRALSGKFETVRDRIGHQPQRIFLKDRPSGRWLATVCIIGNRIQIIPGLNPTLESMLVLRETVDELGGRT